MHDYFWWRHCWLTVGGGAQEGHLDMQVYKGVKNSFEINLKHILVIMQKSTAKQGLNKSDPLNRIESEEYE